MGAEGGVSSDWFCTLAEPKLNNDANLQNSNGVVFAVSSILNMMRLYSVPNTYTVCVYINVFLNRSVHLNSLRYVKVSDAVLLANNLNVLKASCL